jgi:hypothetical protein
VLLAAGVMWRPSRALIGVAVLIAVVAAVLDVSEIAHQLDEDRVGIAVLASARAPAARRRRRVRCACLAER